MAEDLGKLVVRVEADLKNFKNGMDTMKQKADGISSTMKGLGKIVAGAFAVGAVVSAIKDVTKAAMEQEKAENRLQTLAENVPGTTQKQIDALKQLAAAQQNLTTIGDEVTIAGQSQLATFQLSTDTISKLTPAFQDLAVATYGANVSQEQMIQSGNLIGKVMMGNVGALSRVGVSFTDAQEKILKTGTEAEKTAALVEVLGANFGGLAESTRNTTEGSLVAMNNAWGDMKEVMGNALLPTIAQFSGWMANKLPGAMGYVQDAVAKLSPFLEKMGLIFSEKILPVLSELWAWTSAQMPKIKQIFIESFEKIRPTLEKFWDIFVTQILPILKDMFEFVMKNWPTLQSAFFKVFEAVSTIALRLWDIFYTKVLPILKQLYDWVEPYFPIIGKTIGDVFNTIVTAVQFGIDIFEGFIDIIQRAMNWIDQFNAKKSTIGEGGKGGAGRSFAKDVVDDMNKEFGIRSPSKVTAEMGKMLIWGLVDGITENMSKAQTAAKKVSDTIVSVYDKMGDAITQSLRKRYSEQQALAMGIFDAETAEKIKAVQDQIDKINEQTDKENEELKKQEHQARLASLDNQIRESDDADEIKRLRQEKADAITEYEREQLLAQRENQISALQKKMEDIRDQAEEEREFKNKQFEEMMREENLQAEARKLMVDKNNAEIITLLQTYAPKWLDAGQSFGESILNGLNSKKGEITDVVNSILSMVNRTNEAASNMSAEIPAFATGTNFAPGGLALVGEKGPELVNLPRGSKVTPAGETASLLNNSGGGGVTYNITLTQANPKEVGDYIMRKVGMQGVMPRAR
jgi:hypothetical protein